ncbi:MAG: hypothetical protein Q9213_004532 [Squamulea squamosa]
MLRSTTAEPTNRSLTHSPEEAFTLAEQALQGHFRTRIHCMTVPRARMSTAQKRHLPFQVFSEIDREFFRSVLKGNVSLGWSKLAPGVLSRTRPADLDKNLRTRIELSPVLSEEGGRQDVLVALIHQMVHAYYLQCCGYHNQHVGAAGGHDLGHSQAFLALLKCVGQHCQPLRKALSSDLWTPYPRHGRTHHGSLEEPVVRVSSCYARGSRFNDVDIQDWRNTAVATTISLQEAQKPSGASQQVDSRLFPKTVYSMTKEGEEEKPKSLDLLQYHREAYIFLQFENRHYDVLRSSITDLAALEKSPYFKDKSFLQLPTNTSHENFMILWFFLVHRGFPSALRDLNGPEAMISKGPPAIRPYDSGAPKQLMQLLTAFYLGGELKYQAFQDHILTGLRSTQATAEDPMAILEKIYDSPSVSQQSLTSISYKAADPQLREWVRAWLDMDLSVSNMRQYGATHKTNLGVLRHHPTWSQRFAQLRNKSSAFGEDVEIASRAICQRHKVENIRDIVVPIPLQYNVPPPATQCIPLMQQPYQFPSWLPLQNNRAGSQWRGNTPHVFDHNHDPFDMSSLAASLPVEQFQGLRYQPNTPAGNTNRPEDLPNLNMWLRQPQALGNPSSVTDQNKAWDWAFQHLPPSRFQ